MTNVARERIPDEPNDAARGIRQQLGRHDVARPHDRRALRPARRRPRARRAGDRRRRPATAHECLLHAQSIVVRAARLARRRAAGPRRGASRTSTCSCCSSSSPRTSRRTPPASRRATTLVAPLRDAWNEAAGIVPTETPAGESRVTRHVGAARSPSARPGSTRPPPRSRRARPAAVDAVLGPGRRRADPGRPRGPGPGLLATGARSSRRGSPTSSSGSGPSCAGCPACRARARALRSPLRRRQA